MFKNDTRSFQCEFCNQISPVNFDTMRLALLDFDNMHGMSKYGSDTYYGRIDSDNFSESFKDNNYELNMFKCPNCSKVTVFLNDCCIDKNGDKTCKRININPMSSASVFPDYIPAAIRNDYEEAYSILNLSPKASATLSRRCLQGMIRDFYKVSKKTLFDEIDCISSLVDPMVKPAMDALRQLGNIGAHPEKDVNTIIDIEPGEAETLLEFIEFLMNNWYIKRHETEMLLSNVVAINDTK